MEVGDVTGFDRSAHGVDEARALARRSEAGGQTQEVARDFEALLLREVVSAMRKTVPDREGAMAGGQILDGMIETALADHLSRGAGIGLAGMLAADLDGTAGLRAPDGRILAVDADATATPLGVPSSADGEGEASALAREDAPAPLADTLPPEADPWLEDPGAAERLREVLLRGTYRGGAPRGFEETP